MHRGTPTVVRIPLLVVAVLCVLAPARAAESPDAIILFTGAVNGYLDQCGCARFPLGGLDRRVALGKALTSVHPEARLIWLDAGNFSDTPGPAGEVKTRGLVEAMSRMGYAAVGVGERDLLMGVESFTALTGEATFPLIGTNLVRRSTGEPWLSPGTVVRADGLRIAVLSVTRENPAFRRELPGGDAIVTDSPEAAVRRFLPRFRSAADVVVVMALMPIDEARLLVRRIPEIDLVLGAHGSELTPEAIREGRSLVVYAGNEGKNVARIDIWAPARPGDRPALAPTVLALGETLKPDAEMEAFVVERLAAAQEAERAARTAERPQAADGDDGIRYVGSGTCAACHDWIVTDWSGTRHARAWQTLEKSPQGFRRNCVSCHVTGSGRPTGFVDQETTPHLLSVGCEACHGPAGAHVRAPERPYGKVSIATCTSCHTAEMDPTFNYYRD
ncbi:MAG: hypothetical protein D6738_09010, partial [Acidobacteria bacterium]